MTRWDRGLRYYGIRNIWTWILVKVKDKARVLSTWLYGYKMIKIGKLKEGALLKQMVGLGCRQDQVRGDR